MRNTLARLGTFGIQLLCAGCVEYHAAPIEPARVEADFARRTLDDPALADWVGGAIVPAPAFPPQTWDFANLCLAAFWFHPDVDVARAEARTARAGVITASTRPNPTFAFRPEYVLNPAAGASRWVADLALELPIETGGKRDLRADRAERVAQSAEVGVYETAWRLRAGVRARLLAHLVARREVELVRAEAEPRREALALLQRRLEVGSVARPEVARAEIELARLMVEERAATTRAAEALAALASAIGVPASALEDAAFAWAGLEEPVSEAALVLAHEPGFLERFDVRRMLLDYDVAELDVRLEVAKQIPDLALAPGYVYDQGLRKLAFSFALPIPLLDQNRGPIAEAEARRGAAQARFVALEARVAGETERALERYRGALTELGVARALAERQSAIERAIERSFEAGAADRLDVATARAESAVLARMSLAAAGRAQETLGDLEDALQQPLAGAPALPESLPQRTKP